MALRTHNLAPGRLKKRLWWIRWSDVSRCRKAMQNHFLHPGHWKKRLGRSSLSDVLCRRLNLRTYNLLLERLKKRLWYSRWSDDSRSRTPCKLIFCILSIEKSDVDGLVSDVLGRRMAQRTLNVSSRRLKNVFGEFAEAMFQGVERQCEPFFYILNIEISDLDKVA
jgi:hypothetical protein